MATFGKWLQSVIDASGLSLRDFAERTEDAAHELDELHGLEGHGSITHPTISRAVEAHRKQTNPWRAPIVPTLFQIARVANVAPASVFGMFVPLDAPTSIPGWVQVMWADPKIRPLFDVARGLDYGDLEALLEYGKFLKARKP